ncbi:hypothetical protein BGZ93_008398 [Podila epicladia]|nr:hypothetical protein BGZ93_008398 [Podila epicladia]
MSIGEVLAAEPDEDREIEASKESMEAVAAVEEEEEEEEDKEVKATEAIIMGKLKAEAQVAQIIASTRPETIQIAGNGTDDIIVASPSNETIQYFATMVLTKKDFVAFKNLWLIRRFVNSCLLNLSNHYSVDTLRLLPAMASLKGQARLKDIMVMPMSIDAAYSEELLSFQCVVLPLVGVLTREAVCMSTMENESNIIYTIVYDTRQSFIEDGIIRCMQEILDRKSLADHSPVPVKIPPENEFMCVVTSMSCALLAIVRLVFQIVTRIRDARIDLGPTVKTLATQVQTCIEISNETERDRYINKIMVKEVHRLQRIVTDAEDSVVSNLEVAAVNIGAQSASEPINTHAHNSFDTPGARSAYGQRHGNDHAEISEISITPILQEITCSRAPFLPSNGIPDALHFLPHGWKRHVDTHFRLYREDMMNPLRRGMMSFLDVLNQTPFGDEDRLLESKELHKMLDNNVGLNVYGNVKVFGMIQDRSTVGSIKIRFSQPSQIQGATVTRHKRNEFWWGCKNRLMYRGLVYLVSRTEGPTDGQQDASMPHAHLILAVVGRRNIDALAKDAKKAQIYIRLADPQQYLLLLNSASEKSSKRWYLVETPGVCCGSYRKVLKALQHIIPASLPFGKYLAPTIEEQTEITNVGNIVDPPIYACAPTFQYDLSVLVKGQECRLDVNCTTSVERAIRTLQIHGSLDDSQAIALVNTLCREVALINGPPGTDVAWFSIALMQVLLVNKAQSECGPILCIFNTNHALDQFLEHLLENEILDMVRVGTGSKSEKLEQYNLKALVEDYKTSYQLRKPTYEAAMALQSNAKEISQIERTLRGDCLQWEHVRGHLELDYPDLFDQFATVCNITYYTSPDKDDDEHGKVDNTGFTDVDPKKLSRNHAFDRWRTSQDIQEMEIYNKEAQKLWENRANDPDHNPFETLSDSIGNSHLQFPVLRKIPMTNRSIDLLLDCDIWNMSKNERERLLDQWRPRVQGILMTQIGELVKHVETLNHNRYRAMDEIRRGILHRYSVVGITTNGITKYQELIKQLAPKIIICQEAGEVLESHILSSLAPSTQHLILIGDHKQLRPQIATYNLSSDSPIGKKYNLDMSLFERLVTSTTNPLPMSVLTTQRRMRPCISDLIRQSLYPDLLDGGCVHHHPPVYGMGQDLFFMHHDHPEDAIDMYGMQSYSSSFEVNMVEILATYLINNGYEQPGDIAILTPYLGQLSKLRDALKDNFKLVIGEQDQDDMDQNEREEGNDCQCSMHNQDEAHIGVKSVSLQKQLTLCTTGNYQGDEAKIVIISLVRNKEGNVSSISEKIGFLQSPNRTNFLLSRAQHGMFIIGNADLMEHETSGIWPSVIKELRTRNRIGAGLPLICKNHPKQARIVESAEHFNIMAPDGGCTLNCGRGMPCGHICPRQCHPEDFDHRFVKCYRPCDRLHPICQHACSNQCGEPCGDCMEVVGPIELACGHTFEKPTCHQKNNPSTIVCRAKVIQLLPTCRHEREMQCCQDDPATMAVQVDKDNLAILGDTDVNANPILVLSCGHALTMTALDNMMGMGIYYESETDPETEETTYIAKKALPSDEVRQVSCPSCHNPIMQLFRYGRRIKDSQLSMSLKKHQILQQNAMADITVQFDFARGQVEVGHNNFVQALSKAVKLCIDPPPPETRKLGKFTLEADGLPSSTFWTIAETYNIPHEHRVSWFKHIQPVGVVVKRLNEITARAAMSPTKKIFDATVSHIHRLRESRLAISTDPEKAKKDPASTVIQECIRNCGLPPDGNSGSSYVESLAEKTNALLLVLSEATAVLESVGPLSGWYWFVQDLRNCCSVYNSITMEAALKGCFDRRVAYSRVTLLEIICGHVHWMGLRCLPTDKANKKAHLRRVNNLMERFTEEVKELKARCPSGIESECLDRVRKIERRMVIAVNVARGELNQALIKGEKLEVFRAVSDRLHGSRTWYRCSNGHTYVLGMAMQKSRCPESLHDTVAREDDDMFLSLDLVGTQRLCGYSKEDRFKGSLRGCNEGTDDIIVASSASEEDRRFAQRVLKPDFIASKKPEQIRRFVNSCLLNLSNHHRVEISGMIAALASSEEGQARLKDIMVLPMGVDAAHYYGRLSFQFVVLPLIGVLTREAVCESTTSNESHAIYATVYTYRQMFIKDGIIPCMQALLARGSLADHSPAAANIQQKDMHMCVVTSMSCAVLAIVRLMYQIVTRIYDARIDLAPSIKKLAKSVNSYDMALNGTARERHIYEIMVSELNRLQRVVVDAEDAIISPLDVIAADSGVISHNVPTRTQMRLTFDPPGRRSANGPRHDNDYIDITDISILPTQQEITCSRAPFLPSNGVPDSLHFLAHGWKRQVDTHFRLYREDVMDPFRRSMNSFLAVLRHTPFGEEDRLLDYKELRKIVADHVSLNVYGNVQVFGIASETNTTGDIEIGFSQPLQILETGQESRRIEFWECSKNRLMPGSLVCLVGRAQDTLGSGQDASTSNIQLIVAITAQRDTELLARDEKVARIRITLADPLQYLLLLSPISSEKSSKQWFIVESPGTDFGSYRPILKALQHTIPALLPFGKYLAPTIEEQAKIKNIKKLVDPPIYARAPTFQYDISILLNGPICTLDVNSAISIEHATSALQKYSNLDDSQAKALIETLCREVALIHSPPGTGRTLIGLSLVEVLLANKAQSECGPILHIFSTDNGLDWFLEHCLDKGVLDIVRVGSGSKSERLEQYNLQAMLDGHNRPNRAKQAVEEVSKDFKSNVKRIGEIERELKGDCMEWKHVQDLLEQDYPNIYKQFQKMDIDIHSSLPDNYKDEQKFSFDRWKTGLGIQEEITYNEGTKTTQENSLTDPRGNSHTFQKVPSTNRPVDLLLACDVWNMSMNERKRLLDQWRPKIQRSLMAQISDTIKHVEDLRAKLKGATDEIRRGILRQCSVVGITTNGITKYQELIKQLAPKIIICQEAGEVLESHILSSLAPSTQHLILIGDHKQLRPQIATYNLSSDSPIGKKYNLDMSLFERLVTSTTNPLPMSVLTTQRRMRPCISDLIRQSLYPDLLDGGCVHHHPPVYGMAEDLFFMHHDHPEDAKDMYGMQSYSSAFEVDMVKAIATYLVKNGYDHPGDIAIFTPYLNQLSMLHDALKNTFMLNISARDQTQLDQIELEESDNFCDRVNRRVVS